MPPSELAYIGIGSNMDDPLRQVSSAQQALAHHPGLHLLSCSQWYGSKAVGPGTQENYVNGVAAVTTQLRAHDLLTQLHAIEDRHQRRREVRWGPRTLDLDLLLYGGQTIADPRLTVPHPRLAERNFVLKPLLDIDPELCLPDGRRVDTILHIIGTRDLWKIAD